MGDSAGAVKDCTRALELDPDLAWVQPTLAQARAACGMNRAYECEKVAAPVASSHREHGNVLFKNGKYSDAIAAYRDAHAAREDGWVLAISNQAICHLKLGEHAEAVAAADLCL